MLFLRRRLLGACAAEINLLRKRRIGPYFPDFSANRATMHLQIVKIWPRFSTFSLRSFLRRRLLGACAAEINLLRKRRIGPYSPDFSANRTTMHLKIVKIWPRFSTFSLRSFLPRRLLADSREYPRAWPVGKSWGCGLWPGPGERPACPWTGKRGNAGCGSVRSLECLEGERRDQSSRQGRRQAVQADHQPAQPGQMDFPAPPANRLHNGSSDGFRSGGAE